MPAMTLGERGRRRNWARWRTTGCGGAGGGASSVRGVALMVIASSRLPCPGIDEDVDHVRQEVEGEDDQRDDHEDPLDQGVVELAEGVVEVEADPGIVEDDLDQDLAGDDQAQSDRE